MWNVGNSRRFRLIRGILLDLEAKRNCSFWPIFYFFDKYQLDKYNKIIEIATIKILPHISL